MRTRESHIIHESTVNALKERRNGTTLRGLATALGYPEPYAATLANILKNVPGKITAIAEDDLRQRLGLPAIGLRTVPACPSCGAVHVAQDCHGKPVAAVVVLSSEERVTRRRSKRQPAHWVDYATAALRQALENRQPYQGENTHGF